LHRPDAGQVTLLGKPIAGSAPEEIARAGIGRSFQITNLFPALTVRENIRLAVQARDAQAFNIWRRADDLEQVNERTAAQHLPGRGRLAGFEGSSCASCGHISRSTG
jgi:ABC-type branched-subunit amino acid transport system ATPase component